MRKGLLAHVEAITLLPIPILIRERRQLSQRRPTSDVREDDATTIYRCGFYLKDAFVRVR
jgi:hypothetical protein